jgi:hypothetical protein
MLAAEGRVDDATCEVCTKPGIWRCKDCLGQPLYCREHCREFHRAHLFHRIQQWTGHFFAEREMWQVGARLFLGHGGSCCPESRSDDLEYAERFNDQEEFEGRANAAYMRATAVEDQGEAANAGEAHEVPGEGYTAEEDEDELFWEDEPEYSNAPFGQKAPSRDDFDNPFVLIVDSCHLLSLPVVHCGCGESISDDLLFLDLGFFPASFETIKTVFTFRCLDDFRLSNLECKTSAYQYFQRLRRLTNPAFPNAVANRYAELRRVSRQWRNLKLRKWFGFGHRKEDPGRGEMALFCPACPQPGVNLPTDWETRYTV